MRGVDVGVHIPEACMDNEVMMPMSKAMDGKVDTVQADEQLM